MTHSYERAKKVVHYICAKCPDASKKLGIIKMNKTLLYVDRCAYLHTGNTITGLTYVKQRYGPVPQHIRDIFQEMEDEGLIQTSREYPGAGMSGAWLFQSRKEPDMEEFSAEELHILDGVIQEIRDNHTANSISDASHNWAWELAEHGEVIPIGTCLIGDAVKPDSRDMEWADGVLSRLQR